VAMHGSRGSCRPWPKSDFLTLFPTTDRIEKKTNSGVRRGTYRMAAPRPSAKLAPLSPPSRRRWKVAARRPRDTSGSAVPLPIPGEASSTLAFDAAKLWTLQNGPAGYVRSLRHDDRIHADFGCSYPPTVAAPAPMPTNVRGEELPCVDRPAWGRTQSKACMHRWPSILAILCVFLAENPGASVRIKPS
jgi:hypothetical protein